MIQTHWKMAVAMASLKRSVEASIKIQAQMRGAIQRPVYRKELAEAIEDAKLENKVKSLQRMLEEAEAKRIDAEKKAAEVAAEGGKEKEVIVYRESIRDDDSEEKKVEPPSPQAGQFTELQKLLMEESGKMLEYLRKEVFKLRGQNSQLREDFDLLKKNNQKLMDANASAASAFSALNQHTKQLGNTNAKLMSELDKYKRAAHRLNRAQLEAKEALRIKSESYDAEVQAHLQSQETMDGIISTVQGRCKDVRLVQDVLVLHGNREAAADVSSAVSETHSVASQQPNNQPPTPGSTTSSGSKGVSFFGKKSKSKSKIGKKK